MIDDDLELHVQVEKANGSLKDEDEEFGDGSPFLGPTDPMGWHDVDALFKPILVMNEEGRKRSGQQICKYLLGQFDDFSLYEAWVSTLAFNCPFDDVAKVFQDLVLTLKEQRGIQLEKPKSKVSSFISFPLKSTKQSESSKKRNSQSTLFLQKAFIQNPNTTNFTKLIALHPQFGDVFQSCHHFVTRGKGALPHFWRNYLGIMAASRFSCDYLIQQEMDEFLFNGGNELWLQGLEFAPKKLQNLSQLNALLAHQPWLLTDSHIQSLLQGNDQWTASELVQAVVILTTYHGMCSMIHGCGIQPDEVSDSDPSTSFDEDNQDEEDEEKEENTLLQKLTELKSHQETQQSVQKNRELFEQLEETKTSSQEEKVQTTSNLAKNFSGGYTMMYKDFDIHSKDYSCHIVQEWSWDQDAFALLRRYYPGSAELLDKEFKTIHNLTYGTFNTVESDTSRFRHAIRCYIYRIYGMIDDTFDYRHVNLLLAIPLKKYLKSVSCYPERINKSGFDVMTRYGLSDAEKVHVNFLASESRKQCSLVYGLQALSKSLSS